MRSMSYDHGSSAIAIAHGDVVMLVGAEHLHDVDRLWEAAGRVASVVEILDLLISDGFASMPPFAAVVSRGDSFGAIVRGAFAIHVFHDGGPVTWDGRGVSTWAEHAIPFEGFRGMQLVVDDEHAQVGATPLPLVGGIVHASRIVIGEAVPEPVQPARVPDVAPAVSAPPEISIPAAELPPPPPAVTPPPMPEVRDANETIYETDDVQFDAMFGVTVSGRRPEDAAVRVEPEPERAPEPPPPPEPAPAPALDAAPAPDAAAPLPDDLDETSDHTVTRAQLEQERARRTPVPEPAPEPPAEPSRDAVLVPTARLRLSNGKEVVVDGPVLVGRAPQSRNVTSSDLPQIVIVDDPYVSSTHLEIVRADDGLYVTDRSSNGTILARPGLPGTPMPKGERMLVPHGAALQISDAMTIQVSIG